MAATLEIAVRIPQTSFPQSVPSFSALMDAVLRLKPAVATNPTQAPTPAPAQVPAPNPTPIPTTVIPVQDPNPVSVPEPTILVRSRGSIRYTSSHRTASRTDVVLALLDVLPTEIVQHAHVFNERYPCTYCYEEYRENDGVVRLPCTHLFHTVCVQEWFHSGHVSCPLCQLDVSASLRPEFNAGDGGASVSAGSGAYAEVDDLPALLFEV